MKCEFLLRSYHTVPEIIAKHCSVIEAGKEHMLSKQRIDELAPELQIKAHMVKSHVMRTSEMKKLIDPRKMSVETMIGHLKQCARLVQGVWVLDSNLMFNNLPPAHSNTAGKVRIYSFFSFYVDFQT